MSSDHNSEQERQVLEEAKRLRELCGHFGLTLYGFDGRVHGAGFSTYEPSMEINPWMRKRLEELVEARKRIAEYETKEAAR